MLQIKKNIALLLLLTLAVSCENDNFDMPNCSFSGQIIDAQTGEPFQALIGSDYGMVRLYEQSLDYPSPTAEYIPIMADGKFNRSMMPETSYKVDTYMCPLILLDADQVVTLSPNTTPSVTLHCIPYLRLEMERIEGNSYKLRITRPSEIVDLYSDVDGDGVNDLDGTIEAIRICYGVSPYINCDMCSDEGGTLFTVGLATGTIIEDEDGTDLIYEFTFDMSSFNDYDSITGKLTEQNIVAGSYYFRATARIADADTTERNHSNTIYAEYDASGDEW